MSKEKKEDVVVEEQDVVEGKSEEQQQAEIALRGDLERRFSRDDVMDLEPLLDSPKADGMAQVDRILKVIMKIETEIENLQQDTQAYIDYQNTLIQKKETEGRYLAHTIHQWMAHEMPDKKTIKGVNGVMRLTTRSKINYGDPVKLMEWVKENAIKDGIRVKEELNKKVVNEYIKTTGDAPDEELYSVEKDTTFSIKTNKEDKE
jgi:phage host-nuclease inhibitor protein Gam